MNKSTLQNHNSFQWKYLDIKFTEPQTLLNLKIITPFNGSQNKSIK